MSDREQFDAPLTLVWNWSYEIAHEKLNDLARPVTGTIDDLQYYCVFLTDVQRTLRRSKTEIVSPQAPHDQSVGNHE